MDEAKIQEIRQWLLKARHDLRSAERLLTCDPPLLDTAVYHCQQTAEKALKAYLTLQDAPFQKVHVLSVLIEQCMEFDRSFEDIRDIVDVLTPYAIAFRYPGDVLEPDPADAEEAFSLAGLVLDFVAKRMPEGVVAA
jgi:HEPN domain-containing protein